MATPKGKTSQDYKTDGETLIRHLVTRARNRLLKAKGMGARYEEGVVCIPLLKANDIGVRAKKRKEKRETLLQLLGEISNQLDDDTKPLRKENLKRLVDRSIVLTTQIE
jgi:hypothetical protein